MTFNNDARPADDVRRRSVTGRVRAALRYRSVRITLALWVLANVVVFGFSAAGIGPSVLGTLATTGLAAAGDANAVVVLLLIVVSVFLTRKRPAPDIAARAPERRRAAREVTALVIYAVIAQIGGYIVGKVTGGHPISFHLAGTLYGHEDVTPREAYIWSGYNFVVYAVLPYLYFRRRYSATVLNPKSSNRRNDLLVIVVIMVLESINELAALSDAILHLTPGQLLIGAPLTFVLYFLGSVLPTMIFVYSILLPRYLKLTGSVPATVILGGLTYASLHFFEAWTTFSSVAGAVVSVLLLLLQYFAPGMLKSVLTLRTGNAWVHVWGYHALAPHTLIDTPHIVEAFKIT